MRSTVVHSLGVTVTEPATGEEIAVKSLISDEGITFILISMVDNFTGFIALGIVLVLMLGVGLAEKVGLVDSECT